MGTLEFIFGIVIGLFIFLGLCFTFIYFNKKQKHEIKKLEEQRKILELEIEKQKISALKENFDR